jgi:Uma2 family endonuclease
VAITDHPIAGETGLTWDEFLALPYETRNCALIDGEIVVNSPNAPHEVCVKNVLLALTAWHRAAPGRGEASTQQPVGISARRGYQPDLAWYPPEQCAPPGERAAFTGVPAIVVEVFSPSTRRFDLVRKQHDYAVVGVRELWFVDPVERRVMLARQPSVSGAFAELVELAEGHEIRSPLLDGFALAVTDVFAR